METRGTSENLTTGELRRYYDERFARRPLRARKGFYGWIADVTVVEKNSFVLDIGCGGGYLLKELRHNGSRLHACDISSEALRTARREAPEANYTVADAQALPYPDGSFDFVYNLGSLEHFLDMAAALGEMNRVMRDDARAIIMVPNSRYIGDIWRRITFRGGPDHHQLLERFCSLSEWKEIIESAGFRVLQTISYNKFKKRMKFLPLTFAYCFVFVCALSKD